MSASVAARRMSPAGDRRKESVSSPYRIEAGSGQHIGDRQEQQDRVALFAAPRAPGYMMAVVADGMGGCSGGAIAAEQVIRTAKQAFELFSPLTDKVETLLRNIARDAHTIIKLTAIASEKNPHSTAVILILTPERSAAWIHVGDSRLYRFAGPNCVERTVDHSYVQDLVEIGKLSQAEANDHHLLNVLTSSLGSHDSEPAVVLGRHDGLKPGDAFLLCSDGLWQHFTDSELAVAVAAHVPRQACEMLINKARERAAGRGDNCTLAVIKLTEHADGPKTYTAQKMHRAV